MEHIDTLARDWSPQEGCGQPKSSSIWKKNYLEREKRYYGNITFPDHKRKRARYIILGQKSELSSTMSARESTEIEAIKIWLGIIKENATPKPPPALVVSITGGAKDFRADIKVQKAFQKGLSKLGETTDLWIITGGTDKGIMKLVGDVFETNSYSLRPVHLIGVLPLHVISNSDDVQRFEKYDKKVVYYAPSPSQEETITALEPNHTDFILVSDDKKGEYEHELRMRGKLYKSIKGWPSPRSQTANHTVPIVLVAIEGGKNTIRTIHEAVVNNDIPAVIIAGTGRGCDQFALIYDLYTNFSSKHTAVQLKDVVRKGWNQKKPSRMDTTTGAPNENHRGGETAGFLDSNDCFDSIYECFEKQHLIHIVRWNERKHNQWDLGLEIFDALEKKYNMDSNDRPSQEQSKEEPAKWRHEQLLKLALNMDRVDLAKRYISAQNYENVHDIISDDVFLRALLGDKAEFIRLFLDFRFSMQYFIYGKGIVLNNSRILCQDR